MAKVIHVYKKGSELGFLSYRPVSSLSNIETIFKKLIYKRIYNSFTKNNLFYPPQVGFRQQYSSFHFVISLTENFRKILDKRNIGCSIFVDLPKAFDIVEHGILLAKLEHYGIRVITNEIISINGHVSNKASIKCGFP